MTNGAAAAAAGYPVLDGSEDRREGWDEINLTRDLLAGVRPVSLGGTGAMTATTARTNLGLDSTVTAVAEASIDPATAAGKLAKYNSTGKLATNDPTAPLHAANKQYVDAHATGDTLVNGANSFGWDGAQWKTNQQVGIDDGLVVSEEVVMPGVRSYTVATDYASVYAEGSGRMGITPSAERFKQDIVPCVYTLEQLMLIQVVTYRLKVAVESNPDATGEVGVIAEQLIAAGLGEFVIYNAAGQTQSVAYERLVLVTIGAMQDMAGRLADLDTRLATLEAAATS